MKRHTSFQQKHIRFSLKENMAKWAGILLICIVIGVFIFWMYFLRNVPSIESLARGDFFQESTIIYDKDKNPIYTLYKDGKRTYIEYENISQYIKDAIVATEDKTFFTNPGFDLMGIGRAGLNYMLGKTEKIAGTSTISQQLIRNTLLTNERSVKRKVQEIYLSYGLNNTYTKEKILEMYLNAFSFGHNANGIEEASKTYFGKSAKDVGPLGASILASLPKGPSYYSPYSRRDRLMGKVYVYPLGNPDEVTVLDAMEKKGEYQELYDSFKGYLSGMTITGKGESVEMCGINNEYVRNNIYKAGRDGCTDISHDDLLGFFGDIIIRGSGSGSTGDYVLEYTIGRKDFVAGRMFEEGKIDGITFKKIVYDGLEFEFQRNTSDIKHPYFVMYIKDILEEKYGKDIDITSGLKVYTTLDPKLQQKAEELVKKQAEINKKQYGASSAALVSMDNKTGKLLAMVGGPDYNDIENKGNNNMVLANRQPGSSFKPLIYALALSKNPIGPESPVADVETSFGAKYKPDNYDNTFKGIMMVKNALAYSRNIPAVKMFYLAGGEKDILEYVKSLGIGTLKDDFGYGAPLAIGAGEVRPIDMLQAYSVFANMGVKRDIYAIEKIEDSNGEIIEEVKTPIEKEVFSPAASYLIAKILSDNDARPESTFWRNALTVPGKIVAAKTGTSNKEISKDKILPRDLWTIGFSTQITTVVWAGNVNGKETKGTCDGLNCAAAIWKGYMEYALKDLPKEDWKKPEGVYTYMIAKASGKLATEETPPEQKVSTMMAVKMEDYDDGMKSEKIDTLCNGPISENTPESSIALIYIPSTTPIIDGYDPAWTAGFFDAAGITVGTGTIERRDTPCERPGGPGNISINLQAIGVNSDLNSEGRKTLESSWIGDRTIAKFTLKSNDDIIEDISYGTGGKTNGSHRSSLTLKNGANTFTIELVDTFGYKYIESKTLIIGESNISKEYKDPSISMINPKNEDSRIHLYSGDKFNLRFSIDVRTEEREISVTLDDKTIQNATAGEIFVIPIATSGLSTGIHTIKIRVMDGKLKSTERSVYLSVLPR